MRGLIIVLGCLLAPVLHAQKAEKQAFHCYEQYCAREGVNLTVLMTRCEEDMIDAGFLKGSSDQDYYDVFGMLQEAGSIPSVSSPSLNILAECSYLMSACREDIVAENDTKLAKLYKDMDETIEAAGHLATGDLVPVFTRHLSAEDMAYPIYRLHILFIATMMTTSDYQVELPKGTKPKAEPSVTVTIKGEGDLSLQGESMTESQLKSTLEELAGTLEEPDLTAKIVTYKTCSYGYYQKILALVHEAGFKPRIAVTIEEQD